MIAIFPACDAKVRDALRKKHWPKGMGFLPEHDDLLARGWPHLALLIDGDPRDKRAADTAFKFIDAITSPFAITWPRAASIAFLHAFATGERQRAPMEQALCNQAPITVPVADTILGNARESLDFYSFHWRSACFLLEAHLGAEVMADRVLSLLEKLGKSGWFFGNMHQSLLEVVFALELFILRSSPKSAAQSCARLRALYAKRPKDPEESVLVAERLAFTLEGTSAFERSREAFPYSVPFLTVDEKFVPKYLDHEYASWLLDPQLLAIAGPSIASPKAIAGMRHGASWKQVERTVVFGIIRHPVVVEIFATLVGSKSAKGKPEEWIAMHLEYARPVLQKLIAARHPQAAALKKLLAAGSNATRVARRKAKASKTLTSKQLDAGVERVFKKVIAAITKVRGDAKKEATLWKQAATEVTELRAAAGDPMPDERLGHLFGADGWGNAKPPFKTLKATHEEIDRWLEAIQSA